MNLSSLPKVTDRSGKRLGRGIGSGKGKTAARGYKGQKARGKVAPGFIGGTLALYKRLPFRRGLGNTKVTTKMLPVAVEKLSIFKSGTEVTLIKLIETGLVKSKDAKSGGVKLVGSGELKVSLNVALPTTKTAKASIEKSGGKVVSV